MINGKKIMLLGIAIILLGIVCNIIGIHSPNTITSICRDYAHWVGIVITIAGFIIPEAKNK